MSSSIHNEEMFVKRATELYGPSFQAHLRTKGFLAHDFLHSWAALMEIVSRQGVGPRVLDLGCGPGWTSIFLAGAGCHVTAMDASPDMVAIAGENASRLGMKIDFHIGDMQTELPNGPFDSITIIDALHHCPDELRVLGNCFEALRPGGQIFTIEPDWFHEYGPSSRHDREHFQTTERGMGFARQRRAMRACGFVEVHRYYGLHAVSGQGLFSRLRAILVSALTLTVGYPHRPVFVVARKPM